MKIQENTYNNTNRRLKAEETKLSIVKALGLLWTQYSINEITLDMIAEEANVTKRTILRKFGSKEGLMNESLSYDPAEISAERDQAKAGDIDDILNTLLSNYEHIGDAAIRTINLESELEIARRIGTKGRMQHYNWCKRVFAPFLPDSESPYFEIQLTSFIAVTEIYLWKLMRKDLKMSRKKTFSVFKNMLEGVIFKSTQRKNL
jgi:AcrR family transcriptional regulator